MAALLPPARPFAVQLTAESGRPAAHFSFAEASGSWTGSTKPMSPAVMHNEQATAVAAVASAAAATRPTQPSVNAYTWLRVQPTTKLQSIAAQVLKNSKHETAWLCARRAAGSWSAAKTTARQAGWLYWQHKYMNSAHNVMLCSSTAHPAVAVGLPPVAALLDAACGAAADATAAPGTACALPCCTGC